LFERKSLNVILSKRKFPSCIGKSTFIREVVFRVVSTSVFCTIGDVYESIRLNAVSGVPIRIVKPIMNEKIRAFISCPEKTKVFGTFQTKSISAFFLSMRNKDLSKYF